MTDNLSILIDYNIVLDVLQKREPFYEASAYLLAAVETGRVTGYVAAHSLTTLFCLLQKDKGAAEARATLTNLLQFIKVAQVDQGTIEQALNLEISDFEDAVQMMAAVQCKVSYLITCNIKDYPSSLLPIMQPVDFLASIS